MAPDKIMPLCVCILSATPEPGEDPRVTRAKYFIRDEFLVGVLMMQWIPFRMFWVRLFWNLNCACEIHETFAALAFFISNVILLLSNRGSARQAETDAITVTLILRALWTRKISAGYLTTVGTSSRECTWGSMNSCDLVYESQSTFVFKRTHS